MHEAGASVILAARSKDKLDALAAVPEGVAILHVADNPEAFGREQPAFTPEDRIGVLEMQTLGVLDNRELLLHFAKVAGTAEGEALVANALAGEAAGE